ncbi:MAG TPA: NnrS family protein [Polyangiaceae bacterium]|jgi:uncharacterized protein involved in response to NO
MQRLLLHDDVPALASRPRWALGASGFRPFFLLAAAFATAIVPLWILVVAGVARPTGYLDATSWHAHEMVMGYAVAVIAGFLLTAVGNWTKRVTLLGTPLLALAALWVLGRVAMAFASILPRGVPALVDLAFLPALIVVLARPLVAARNWRNLIMLAFLGALFAANLVVHLDALGAMAIGAARHACLVATDVVMLVILVMAGRVFPMFTRNATGVASIRSIPSLDALTVAGMAVLTALDVLVPERAVTAVAAAAVGLLAIARAARWGTRHTARHPLLWILHAGYAWMVLGLLLRGLARVVPAIPGSLATHAVTVGAIGSLTLGMMARVSLGHSGRALVAPRAMAWGFAAITAAAFARAIVPLFAPGWYLAELVAAAGLWTVAFLLFLVAYLPVLVTPRVDGKPG